MTNNPEKNWFGYKQIDENEKTSLVMDVFDSVAPKYDIMNDAMSFGIHRLWKNRLIREINPRPHYKYLDVAGGTGDIAFKIQEKCNGKADITICDINYEMLNIGRDRAIDKGQVNKYSWITGNAETLPIPSSSMDIYTIAFGLRNVTRIDNALQEAYRILKPGGRFYCLEFSHVTEPFFKKIYDIYSDMLIPKMGEIIAKDKDSYQYLVESIRKFPKQEELAQRIKNAKFDKAGYKNLSNGIVAIHIGEKL